ncbi:TolC family protein [Brevibacillus laterosporus]|uniref:TolC family protein n=1 Tax=Brevibacillus halotolerans TaxID=1507437 RepID=A0ABT4I0Q9_9BACL|nr:MULTISPECIES: TolC family protein [Brevibacillus]MCR8986903.1 TolC family protein [Brevibacillus laterosporus]MCZ0832639.1 TolC family protein [Brevibacillus halotolerans]
MSVSYTKKTRLLMVMIGSLLFLSYPLMAQATEEKTVHSQASEEENKHDLTPEKAGELALEQNIDLKKFRLELDTADINANQAIYNSVKMKESNISSLGEAQQKYVQTAKAEAARNIHKYMLQAMEDKTKLGAEKAFYELWHAKQDLQLQEQSLTRAQKQVDTANTLFTAGIKAKNDVLQAETGLAQAKANHEAARNQVHLSTLSLNQFLAEDLTKEWELSIPEGDIRDKEIIPLEEAKRLAVVQRAEILKSDEEVKAAKKNVDTIEKYSILSSFQGQLAKNELETAEMNKEQIKNDILLEVTRNYEALTSAKQGIEALDKAREASKENYRLTQLRYENGLATTLDVMTAEEELAKRANEYETALHNYQLAYLNYKNSMGRPVS